MATTAAASGRAASSLATSTSEGDDGDRSRHRSSHRRAVPASRLVAANVYVSEGRDRATIDRLVSSVGGWRGRARGEAESDVNAFDFDPRKRNPTTTGRPPSGPVGAALVHVFVDEPYNRTGFTLAGLSSEAPGGGGEGEGGDPSSSLASVPDAVAALAKEALSLIDWRRATGTHPAIGVVDHVAVHPLFPRRREGKDRGGGVEGSDDAAADDDDDDEASAVARRVAASLGELGVPTYLYGAAKAKSGSERTKLADVRRSLNYFRSGGRDESSSSPPSSFERFPDPLPPPDSGPATADPAKGAAAVGSVPWVMNVNVPLSVGRGAGEGECRPSLAAAASSVARAVSARRGTPVARGGFAHPGVEALALPHAPGVVEVACNLTDGRVEPLEVALAVEAAAREAGLSVASEIGKEDDGGKSGSWYVTGKSASEVAEEAAEVLGLEVVAREGV